MDGGETMARNPNNVDVTRRTHMGALIRQKRLAAGMEQAELARHFGVTAAAIGNWERGVARPDFDLIPGICRVLRISVTELLGVEPELGLTGRERELLQLYRGMNPAHRAMVMSLMLQLTQDEERQRRETLRQSVAAMRAVYGAAAGFGAPMEGEPPTEQLYVRRNPCQQKSTLLVRVNGESMEPVYMDGSFVYVDERRTPQIGDDVVVIYENTLYIKQFTPQGLQSYNPDKKRYPTIKVDGWLNVRCVGVVTGRVNDYDILRGEELREVQMACAEAEDR